MNTKKNSLSLKSESNKFGFAWVSLSLALAIHVVDEALNDFLSVYNPFVTAIKEKSGYIPLPTFNFYVWMTGLVVAILVLFLLSPYVFQRAGWMIPLAVFFGVLMFFNGIIHIFGTFYLGYKIPGVYSSPLLIICSIYLIFNIRRL